MNSLYRIILIALSIAMVSCDSGDIYPEEERTSGREIKASFTMEGLEAFPQSEYYQIVFGAFEEDAQYPLIFRKIEKPATETSDISITLSNIPDNADYIHLALLDKGKKLIHNFYSYPIGQQSQETITLPRQNIQLATYERLQKQLFTIKCIACHGGSDITARGLNLTETASYAALVNKNSMKFPGKKLIKPGSPSESFITEALTVVNTLAPDHVEMVKEDDVNILRAWIEKAED